ncbi:MAG: ATP-binding protein [Deltaproteobacteria bacterium]|nr:ATP-binding protein [Deltaproteobacteria bacterium]
MRGSGGLQRALTRLAHRLERRLGELRTRGQSLAIEPGHAADDGPELLSAGLAPFEHVAEVFELTDFEREVLLLALAPEVEARFFRLFGLVDEGLAALRPTVGLAMATLARWPDELGAFLPHAPLLRHGLLMLEGEAPLASRPLRIAPDLWPRLAGLATPPVTPSTRLEDLALVPSTAAQAETAVRALRDHPWRDRSAMLVAVRGDRGHEAVAAAIAGAVGPVVLAAEIKDALQRMRLVRAAMWDRATLVVEHGASLDDVLHLCREAPVPVVAALEEVDLPTAIRVSGRTLLEVAIAPSDDAHRRGLWSRACGEIVGLDIALLAARYRFDPERIAATAALARARASSRGGAASADDVLAACRTMADAAARTAGHLIRKLDARGEGHELVVPIATRCELELLEEAAREGHRVLGAAGGIGGGAGIVALFAGPPGTGKTLAAQVIARRLGIDVLRIDLSQLVDKYIGETEKHLDRVFRACETSGATLFFDEADALFGKRTEVRDAHDRYANIETAFLLQRLEQHPGIAVLATNLKQNLDVAFLRRLHFVVEFPLPDHADRRRIWQLHIPPGRGDADLDLDLLARFELAGGDIRNAVMAAAILGARHPTIAMKHLAIAVWRELRKSGRMSMPGDFGPWATTVEAYARDGGVP